MKQVERVGDKTISRRSDPYEWIAWRESAMSVDHYCYRVGCSPDDGEQLALWDEGNSPALHDQGADIAHHRLLTYPPAELAPGAYPLPVLLQLTPCRRP